MPIAAGLWLANPHRVGSKKRRKVGFHKKRKRSKRRRNIGVLSILNPKRRSKLKTRRRKRSTKRRHHRRKSYAANPRRRRRSTTRRRRYYGRKRRRSHRRRNPLRARSRRRSHRRSRRYGRRRNAGTNIVSRSYRVAKSFTSKSMIINVAAGVAGYAGVNLLEPFIPYAPSSNFGAFVKKGLAAVGAYVLGSMVLKSRSQKRWLMSGAALNLGLDLVRTQLPALAAKANLSGYRGYSNGMDTFPTDVPARYIPYLSNSPIG